MNIHPTVRCAGKAAGRLAVGVSRAVAAAYHAVDPDFRRHLAQMPVLGLTLLARRRPPIVALPDDGARPILCIHGLGGHRGNFTPLRAWLRFFGRSRVYSIGFRRGLLVEGMAKALRADIATVLDVNGLAPDAQVDLVCHSMGGIVARIALEDPATAARVATVITLGTPHAGTHAARYASTFHTRALRPGSGLMERLAKQTPWSPAMPRLVCLWSAEDVFLLPAETARVDGAHNRRVPGVTHLSYLLNPVSFHAVVGALSPAPPELLASSPAAVRPP